jgi:tetratricopeptide (TPR) repeat protein
MVDGMAQMVFTASEGHPLTVVEMVRSLPDLDNGELPPRLTLPERVRRLIDRRFELLSAGARHALGVAAVIGRDFEYRLFARACGTPADDAVGGLEELVRRRVLHAVGDRFAFTHDRLREVAYADLIAPRRRLLHRRVAEAMEALVGTQAADHHASIGAHYADAEVWEPAARHFRDAARVAHERLAFRDGVVLCERALAALRRLDRTQDTIVLEIDTRLRLFRCLTPLGDPAAGEQVMLAQTLLADARDESREAIVLVELAELRRSARQLDAALEAGRQALTVAARLGHERVRALAHFQVGVAHFTRAAYPEAVEHLTATISLLAHAPLPEQLGYPYVPALCRLSWAYVDLDDLDAARRYAEAALQVAEAGDHIPSSAEALTTLAVLRLACGRPGDAIAPLERATELAQTCGVPYLGSFSGSWLALAYARCRRDDDAKIVLDECEARRVWEHVRLQWSRIVVRLGEARRLIGHIDRAGHLGEQGYMLAKSIGEPLGEIEALRLLARASSRRPPTRTSGLRDALAVAERIRVPGVTRELRAELTQSRHRPARSRATAG